MNKITGCATETVPINPVPPARFGRRFAASCRDRPSRARGAVLWAAVVLLLLNGCNQGGETPAQAPQGPPPKVKVAHPLAQEVTDWDEYTGRIQAVYSIDVRARVSGYLEQVNFTAGDHVKEGELLFLIDPKPYQAQLNFALADLEQRKIKLALAKNDLERARGLLKAKAISVEEYDTRNKGYQESKGAVRAAEANVYAARLNVDYCRITSPIDGRIGRNLIDIGNMVNGGGMATVLTNIVSIDPVNVYVNVDERSIIKYQRQSPNGTDIRGLPARLGLVDETGYPHRGTIDYVSPQADPNTGTVAVRGVFANPDGLLNPGFFARVRIRADKPHPALLLPDRALGMDQALHFVWVVNSNNEAEYRKVAVGRLHGELRIVTDGLSTEDLVIIEGLQKVRPGSKVTPEVVDITEQDPS